MHLRWIELWKVGRHGHAILEGLEFWVQQCSTRVLRAEGLTRMGSWGGGETVLVEGAIEGCVVFQLLERVGGAAEGIGGRRHGGDWLRVERIGRDEL